MPQSAPAQPVGRGPELLRRVLLGLATALIAVRALVPGEDVGLLDPQSTPWGLIVPLLWLCGLAGWAVWRIWSRQLDWYAGLIEIGLLVVVLSCFFGTASAKEHQSYQHAAWVVAWEWTGLVAAFFLIRQLARSPADQRALLAVLLATGVCLAVQSLWQRALPDRGAAPVPGLTADDLPRWRCQMLTTVGTAPLNPFPANLSLLALHTATNEADPMRFERIAVKNNVRPESGEPVLPPALRPRPPDPPAATFTSESNLAGCLALLLPALVGCVLASWLGGSPRWQQRVALACALLTALALWLTQVRSAILPCLLVGAAASVLAWRYLSARSPLAPVLRGEGSGVRGSSLGKTKPLSPDPSPRSTGARGDRRRLLALALAGPAALLILAFVLRPSSGQGFGDLAREWSAAGKMIGDHFWIGVGPGNYGRHYPRYMTPTAPVLSRQPDNFLLETWAMLGLPALLALAVVLAIFFRRTLSFVPRPSSRPSGDEPETPAEDQGPRWEFYEGGMIGLVFGFLFRSLSAGPEVITAEMLAAAVRAVIWFAVFALILGIRWTGATRVLACTAGVAALLLHLLFAGGLSVPGVAQPLWLLAALALNGLPERPVSFGHQLSGRVVPLVLASAAALMCLMQLTLPLTSGYKDNRAALAMAQTYLDERSGIATARDDGQREAPIREVKTLNSIAKGLWQAAMKDDPGNSRYFVDAANWYAELYEAFPEARDERGNLYLREALGYARDAQEFDPLNEAGYLAEARIHTMVARADFDPAKREKARGLAVNALLKIVEHRPHEPQLQYHLAVALFRAGQVQFAKQRAAEALQLDSADLSPARRLSEAQRRDAERLAR